MNRWINGWLVDGRSVEHLINLSVIQLINLSVNQSMCFNCPIIQSEYTRQFSKGFVLGCLYQNMLDDLISIQISQSQCTIKTRVSQNFSTAQICKSLQPLDKNSTYHNLLSITVKPSLLHDRSWNSRAIRRISRSHVDRKTAFGNLCFMWNLNRKYKIQKS